MGGWVAGLISLPTLSTYLQSEVGATRGNLKERGMTHRATPINTVEHLKYDL